MVNDEKTWCKVKNFLNENLDGFCLVGYTLEGNRIEVVDFSTHTQEDALDTLMASALNRHKVPDVIQILTEQEEKEGE